MKVNGRGVREGVGFEWVWVSKGERGRRGGGVEGRR